MQMNRLRLRFPMAWRMYPTQLELWRAMQGYVINQSNTGVLGDGGWALSRREGVKENHVLESLGLCVSVAIAYVPMELGWSGRACLPWDRPK